MLTATETKVDEAKDALSHCRQRLDEHREAFLLSQEAMNGLMVEVQDLSRSLRERLTQLYEHKFVEHDSGMYGRRGEVTWMDSDPNSATRWRKAWRRPGDRAHLISCSSRALQLI